MSKSAAEQVIRMVSPDAAPRGPNTMLYELAVLYGLAKLRGNEYVAGYILGAMEHVRTAKTIKARERLWRLAVGKYNQHLANREAL